LPMAALCYGLEGCPKPVTDAGRERNSLGTYM
jgi:hypothetical protein